MDKLTKRPPFACIALVLQGGGALGSYQAGVYEAMAEIDLQPDWVAGISIGAINAAIIAGNPAKDRVAKLKQFWNSITVNPLLDWALPDYMKPWGDQGRSFFNQLSAGFSMASGAAGFFEPRNIMDFMQLGGTSSATSFYDTSKLKTTLEQVVDFDRLNNDGMRLSVGAVNVRTGNFAYFENTKTVIKPEHIIASASLPPGFAATEIDGEYYWDGGLVSNTPLQWVVDSDARQDTLAFQVDLWPARGKLPQNLADVMSRQKEIQYSSRTRAATDQFAKAQRLRGILADLFTKLPADFETNQEFAALRAEADRKAYNIVHLIYRSQKYESHSKDYDFSSLAMGEHWQAGYQDSRQTLEHAEIFERPTSADGVAIYDFVNKEG